MYVGGLPEAGGGGEEAGVEVAVAKRGEAAPLLAPEQIDLSSHTVEVYTDEVLTLSFSHTYYGTSTIFDMLINAGGYIESIWIQTGSRNGLISFIHSFGRR